MNRFIALALVLSLLGATTFAQELPSGVTVWEYATLDRVAQDVLSPFQHTWRASGVENAINGEFDVFARALAEQLGFDFEDIHENLRGGPIVLNLVGLAGWELVTYVRLDNRGSFAAVFKRPRP